MASETSDWIVLGETIKFTANLQKSPNPEFLPLFPDKTSDQEEFLMTLEAQIDNKQIPWLHNIKNENVEFLVILDKSGSMGGRPWTQVQNAAAKMDKLVKQNEKVNLSFVVYDSKAQFSDALTIQTTRASGMTNFVDAFLKIEEHMTKLKTSNSQGVNPKLIVFFMTDGEDTVSKPSAINCAKEHLQAEMGKYGAEVIVNVLGFSANHDDRFLESLSLLGTSDGSYQFIGEDTGEVGLEKHLCQLIEGATGLVGKSAFVSLEFAQDSGYQFLGNWMGKDFGMTQVSLHAFIQVGESSSKLETSKFVLLKSGIRNPEDLQLMIKVHQDLLETSEITEGEIQTLNISEEKEGLVVELRKLRASLNMLTTKISESSETKDLKVINQVQNELKPFYANIMKNHQMVIAKNAKLGEKDDPEMRQLVNAVESGLHICGQVLNDSSSDANHRSKAMRSTEASYKMMSNQRHNLLQAKKIRYSEGYQLSSPSTRTPYQQNQSSAD